MAQIGFVDPNSVDLTKMDVSKVNPSAFKTTGPAATGNPWNYSPGSRSGSLSAWPSALPGQNSQATDLQSILRRLADSMEADLSAGRSQRDALYSSIAGKANPYGQGNPGLQNLLALQQGSIQRNFADAREQTMRSLAQRGALGTAQETSALRQLAMDQGRATSGAEAQTRADAYGQEQRYETMRDSQLASLLGMLRGGGGASTYASLLAREDGLADQAWNRQQYQDQQNQQLVSGALRLLPLLLMGG